MVSQYPWLRSIWPSCDPPIAETRFPPNFKISYLLLQQALFFTALGPLDIVWKALRAFNSCLRAALSWYISQSMVVGICFIIGSGFALASGFSSVNPVSSFSSILVL
ncbi:hypothetical protein C8J56DRAFT_362519 [Mycena floridula]|nr:hypothetical protein C8J56DRAFT_362519 [Mycena floridula]